MEDKFERLGLVIDAVDNLVHALELPLPPDFHLNQLKSMLPEKVNLLKKCFEEITEENPWK